MLKIALKSFKYNMSRYLLFFLGIALAVSQSFIIIALVNPILSSSTGLDFVGAAFNHSLPLFTTYLVVMIVVIYFSLRGYISKRIRDYKVLLLLGARPIKIVRLLIIEYFIGFLLSLVVGLLLGNAGYFLIRLFINIYFNNMIGNHIPSLLTYIIVLINTFVMMIMVAYFSYFRLNKYVFENLILLDEKNEDLPSKKRRLVYLPLGIIILLVSVFMFYGMGELSFYVLPALSVLWSAGVILLFYSIGVKLLFLVRNNKNDLV